MWGWTAIGRGNRVRAELAPPGHTPSGRAVRRRPCPRTDEGAARPSAAATESRAGTCAPAVRTLPPPQRSTADASGVCRAACTATGDAEVTDRADRDRREENLRREVDVIVSGRAQRLPRPMAVQRHHAPSGRAGWRRPLPRPMAVQRSARARTRPDGTTAERSSDCWRDRRVCRYRDCALDDDEAGAGFKYVSKNRSIFANASTQL
jgi:hypothetical protein